MRLIGSWWHCFEYTPAAPGPYAIPVDPSTVGTPAMFFDCMVVRVVVEPGDHPLTDAAVHAIRYLCEESDAAYIVLAGVPHSFSSDNRGGQPNDQLDRLTHVAETLAVLSDFAERLEEYGERVHLMPFGWQVASRSGISVRRADVPHIQISESGETRQVSDAPLLEICSTSPTFTDSVPGGGALSTAPDQACAFDLAGR